VGIGSSTGMYWTFSAASAHISGARPLGVWKLTVRTWAQQHQHSASEGVPGALGVCVEVMLLDCCNGGAISSPSSHPGTKIHTNAPPNSVMASNRFQMVESSMC
jgi:hypothetical protein